MRKAFEAGYEVVNECLELSFGSVRVCGAGCSVLSAGLATCTTY